MAIVLNKLVIDVEKTVDGKSPFVITTRDTATGALSTKLIDVDTDQPEEDVILEICDTYPLASKPDFCPAG